MKLKLLKNINTIIFCSVGLSISYLSKAQNIDSSFHTLPKQINSESSSTSLNALRKNIFILGFGFEGDKAPFLSTTFHYLFSPGHQRKYYMGFGISAMGGDKTENNRSFNGHTGAFHNDQKIVSLDFAQKFFFNNGKKIVPMISLNAGFRNYSQDVYLEYKPQLNPIIAIIAFPFSLLPATDSIYQTQQSCLSVAVGSGLFFSLHHGQGITVALNFHFAKPFQTYSEPRKSRFIVLTMAIQIGWDKKKYRR